MIYLLFSFYIIDKMCINTVCIFLIWVVGICHFSRILSSFYGFGHNKKTVFIYHTITNLTINERVFFRIKRLIYAKQHLHLIYAIAIHGTLSHSAYIKLNLNLRCRQKINPIKWFIHRCACIEYLPLHCTYKRKEKIFSFICCYREKYSDAMPWLLLFMTKSEIVTITFGNFN